MSASTISIITAVYNRADTIQGAINSIRQQSYQNVQHVIIDGNSTDGTVELIRNDLPENSIFVSEPDEGIYDALNKGFLKSTGDVIGILHSDDVFYDETVLVRVAEKFKDSSVGYVYGDIEMISESGEVVRDWRTGQLKNGKITNKQIPHPALFLSRSLLTKLSPPFDTSYRISADLKQQLIIANILNAKGVYISEPLVKMRIGGASTNSLSAYMNGWVESRRAWNEVHGSGGALYVLKKVLSKIKGIRR